MLCLFSFAYFLEHIFQGTSFRGCFGHIFELDGSHEDLFLKITIPKISKFQEQNSS